MGHRLASARSGVSPRSAVNPSQPMSSVACACHRSSLADQQQRRRLLSLEQAAHYRPALRCPGAHLEPLANSKGRPASPASREPASTSSSVPAVPDPCASLGPSPPLSRSPPSSGGLDRPRAPSLPDSCSCSRSRSLDDPRGQPTVLASPRRAALVRLPLAFHTGFRHSCA